MTNTKQDEITPGPWRVEPAYPHIVTSDQDYDVAVCRDYKANAEANAAFIVEACNAYTSTEALRSALAELLAATDPARGRGSDRELEARAKAVAALSSSPPPSTPSVGYLYFTPDTGTEFSKNHPVESGECDDAENVREATAEVLRDELLEAWRGRGEAEVELSRKMEPVQMSTLTEAQIKHMVDRFLMWKLPTAFNPDGGISFERIAGAIGPHPFAREPVGTNLLSADQATEMVRHMLEGLPSGSPPPSTEGLRGWLPIETAPRDGTAVLGIDAKGRTRKMWWFAPSSRTQHWMNCETQSPFKAVGWMPLPPAPDAARTPCQPCGGTGSVFSGAAPSKEPPCIQRFSGRGLSPLEASKQAQTDKSEIEPDGRK